MSIQQVNDFEEPKGSTVEESEVICLGFDRWLWPLTLLVWLVVLPFGAFVEYLGVYDFRQFSFRGNVRGNTDLVYHAVIWGGLGFVGTYFCVLAAAFPISADRLGSRMIRFSLAVLSVVGLFLASSGWLTDRSWVALAQSSSSLFQVQRSWEIGMSQMWQMLLVGAMSPLLVMAIFGFINPILANVALFRRSRNLGPAAMAARAKVENAKRLKKIDWVWRILVLFFGYGLVRVEPDLLMQMESSSLLILYVGILSLLFYIPVGLSGFMPNRILSYGVLLLSILIAGVPAFLNGEVLGTVVGVSSSTVISRLIVGVACCLFLFATLLLMFEGLPFHLRSGKSLPSAEAFNWIEAKSKKRPKKSRPLVLAGVYIFMFLLASISPHYYSVPVGFLQNFRGSDLPILFAKIRAINKGSLWTFDPRLSGVRSECPVCQLRSDGTERAHSQYTLLPRFKVY